MFALNRPIDGWMDRQRHGYRSDTYIYIDRYMEIHTYIHIQRDKDSERRYPKILQIRFKYTSSAAWVNPWVKGLTPKQEMLSDVIGAMLSHTYTHMYLYIHLYLYLYLSMFIYIYIYFFIYTHVCTYICIYVYMYISYHIHDVYIYGLTRRHAGEGLHVCCSANFGSIRVFLLLQERSKRPREMVLPPKASTVESRIGPERGSGLTPGELLTISKPNPYPKSEKPPARKWLSNPTL